MDFEEAMEARSNPVFSNETSKSKDNESLKKAKASLIQLENEKDDKEKEKTDANQTSNSTTVAKRYVHLIPHSHTSEGFMSTPESYFSGSDNN